MLKRRRVKQVQTLAERLAAEGLRLKERAKALPPGLGREGLLRRARQIDTAVHLSEWLSSPGLKPPT